MCRPPSAQSIRSAASPSPSTRTAGTAKGISITSAANFKSSSKPRDSNRLGLIDQPPPPWTVSSRKPSASAHSCNAVKWNRLSSLHPPLLSCEVNLINQSPVIRDRTMKHRIAEANPANEAGRSSRGTFRCTTTNTESSENIPRRPSHKRRLALKAAGSTRSCLLESRKFQDQ